MGSGRRAWGSPVIEDGSPVSGGVDVGYGVRTRILGITNSGKPRNVRK